MRFPSVFRQTALTLSIASAAGCTSTELSGPLSQSAGIQAGKITVSAGSDGLTLSNQTERVVYFTAFESDLATLIDWIPCTGGAGCKSLVQGERRVVAWSTVAGYDSAKPRYLVYWWNADVGPDGSTRAANIQTVVVNR
jgi:hypothetical protein